MKSLSIAAAASLILAPFASHAGENTRESIVDLEGVVIQNGKSAKANSGTDTIEPSVLYQYSISGTVVGSGAFSYIESGTDLATLLDSIDPGFSEELTGIIVNPSGKLPLTVVSKKLKGAVEQDPISVSAKATVKAAIKKSGQAGFALSGVSIKAMGLPIAISGKITFEAGSTCRLFIPSGSDAISRSDVILFSGKEDAVGNNVYNTDGANQSIGKSLKKGQSLTVNVLVQNDGTGADSIVVTGPASSANVSVTYKLGNKNVTKDVTGDGLTLADLPAGGGKSLKAIFKAKVTDASFTGFISAEGSGGGVDSTSVTIGAL